MLLAWNLKRKSDRHERFSHTKWDRTTRWIGCNANKLIFGPNKIKRVRNRQKMQTVTKFAFKSIICIKIRKVRCLLSRLKS